MADNGEGFGKVVKLGAILFAVTAITGAILGVVHDITLAPIKKTQEAQKAAALAEALPSADAFEQVEVAGGADAMIRDVQRATNGTGWCITVAPRGYGGLIEVVVGVKDSGGVSGIRILSHSETPGLGARAPEWLPPQFEGKDSSYFEVVKVEPARAAEIQAISGATVTSQGVVDGVNAALEYWNAQLKGGN